jgi:DNA-directed RNA polymerase subunit RPC12/RpoP
MGPTLETQMGGQTQVEYFCSNCGKSVPEHINDRCPHCGIRFDYVEQPDGSRKYNSHYVFGSIGGVIAVVVGIAIRLLIFAGRNR